MLSNSEAFSGFAVDDLDAARAFYADTLGLTVERNEMGFLDITLGSGAHVLAYEKPDHEPAGFTILNFEVEDVEQAVDALIERGVTMEKYEGFDQDEKGIMRGQGPDIAWFKDPAGNVLAVLKG
jgi:catechol 2,3-dioxygenase-like lactoylglutathione lyase family enzyme